MKVKRALALSLSLLLYLGALTPLKALAQEGSCENGECTEEVVQRLEDLGKLFLQECSSKTPFPETPMDHFEAHGLSERCYQYMGEINRLEGKLRSMETQFENRLGCENGECKGPDSPHDDINSKLRDLQKVEKNLSCTEEKKAEVRKHCGDDLKCSLMAASLGLDGILAEKLVPKSFKPANCNLADDSCTTQLATGFLKSVVNFFEGSWDLLKAGGKFMGRKAGEFWDWVRGSDDHASTSQLALAKASEEEGVFSMLLKDFSGTMGKLFEALVASIKEWMKNDLFCSKWEKVPHFSQCLEPMESFSCLSCKGLVNGLCGASGYIIAEVVPAFLTGGLITAAKYGANGAAKIAKLFKVSDATMEAIKSMRIVKLTVEAGSKVDDVLQLGRGLKLAKASLEAALKVIRTYFLNPTRKVLKASNEAFAKLSAKGDLFLAQTRTGKILVFGAKGAKFLGKAVIFPIDNPMTAWAFKTSEKSFEKLFHLGAPRLAQTTAVTGAILKADPALESVLAKIELARMNPKAGSELLKLEEELLAKIGPDRAKLLDQALTGQDPRFEDIVQNLYPELQYGPLARKSGKEIVLKAEKELLDHVNKLEDGPLKDQILKRYHLMLAKGEARMRVVGDVPPGGKIVPPVIKHEVPDFLTVKTLKAGKEKEEALLKAMKETGLDPREINELLLAHRGHLEMVPVDELEDAIKFIAKREEMYAKGTIKSSKAPREAVREELDSILGVCKVK